MEINKKRELCDKKDEVGEERKKENREEGNNK